VSKALKDLHSTHQNLATVATLELREHHPKDPYSNYHHCDDLEEHVVMPWVILMANVDTSDYHCQVGFSDSNPFCQHFWYDLHFVACQSCDGHKVGLRPQMPPLHIQLADKV